MVLQAFVRRSVSVWKHNKIISKTESSASKLIIVQSSHHHYHYQHVHHLPQPFWLESVQAVWFSQPASTLFSMFGLSNNVGEHKDCDAAPPRATESDQGDRTSSPRRHIVCTILNVLRRAKRFDTLNVPLIVEVSQPCYVASSFVFVTAASARNFEIKHQGQGRQYVVVVRTTFVKRRSLIVSIFSYPFR